ncbi:MAG: molecular chaperone TorD family protein [Hyphomicrobiaceae bacterium]
MQESAQKQHELRGGASEEDAARAMLYGLLARLLSRSPDRADLELLQQAVGGEGGIGAAIALLGASARTATVQSAAEEYQGLFVGLGRGELVPYGSYYLTGFLQEKPLAKLRRDMAALGVQGKDDCPDPEDHAASVLEVMGGLIDGRFGRRYDSEAQRVFFDAYLGSWLPVFFGDLEKAKSAQFYRAVGQLGRAFLDVESAQFRMAA